MWGLGLTSKNKLFVKYTVETGTYRNSIKIFDNLIYENKLQTNYSKVESQKGSINVALLKCYIAF